MKEFRSPIPDDNNGLCIIIMHETHCPADSTAPGWIARQDAALSIIVTCDPWQNRCGYGRFHIRNPRYDNDHEVRKWSQTDADDADEDCPWAPAWGMRRLGTAREKQQGSSEDYATGESNSQAPLRFRYRFSVLRTGLEK